MRLVELQLTVRMVRRIRDRLKLESARVRARRGGRGDVVRLEEFVVDDGLQGRIGGRGVRAAVAIHDVRWGSRLGGGVQIRRQRVRVQGGSVILGRSAGAVALRLVRHGFVSTASTALVIVTVVSGVVRNAVVVILATVLITGIVRSL